MVQSRAASTYAVHWVLYGNTADRYGKAIRQSWRRSRAMPGERRMVCHHLADVVVVMFETVADDVSRAIDETEGLVMAPLERHDLPLPHSVVVVATAVN